MDELKFKGSVRKWSNSFVVTVPMSYIENSLVKEGETYEFVIKKVSSDE